MLGIWLAARGQRLRVALAGGACVLAFLGFLVIRYLFSGFLYPDYHYHAMSNSPSIWAAYYLLIDPIAFDDPIRPYVKIFVVGGMLMFLAVAWRRRMSVWSAVVASHCAFFACFIGIHPEHYQWFLPFLIVFAWDALAKRKRLAFWLAVGVTYLAYAYKIVYGLRGPPGNTAGGKFVLRELFERHVGIDLRWLQITLLFMTLATLLVLTWQALRMDSEENVNEKRLTSAFKRAAD